MADRVAKNRGMESMTARMVKSSKGDYYGNFKFPEGEKMLAAVGVGISRQLIISQEMTTMEFYVALNS
ncbi:hypothetical protein Q1695_006648 [Nippostrongylus brasiliensis]|nr:hypothetical protein Q1695_006648 [Nippostrongylus brasiliensis]